MDKKTVTITIRRFDPLRDSEPLYQKYTIAIEKGATVLSVLRDLYEQQDHSLAFYYSCRIGKCAGCQVTVNGKTCLACNTIVDGDITLEPQKGYKVVKDLYVDKEQKVDK